MCQLFGFLYGGVLVVLVEIVVSLGVIKSVDIEKEICVGLEINVNYIKGKKDGIVIVIGVFLYKGKKIVVWEVKI